MGPVHFVIYINDTDLGLSNLITKFADDTKTGNAALSEQDMQSLQKDLRKLSDWSEKWEMPFNINKWQVLQISYRNKKMENEMCGVKIKSVQSVKDLGVTVSTNLKFSKQCNEAVKKSKHVGFHKAKFLIQECRCCTTIIQQFCYISFGVCRAVSVSSPREGHC